MDWQSIVILAIVIFALVWIVTRLKGRARNPSHLRVAMELISNINDDLKLIVQKQANPDLVKKFKINSWRAYQEHLGFLEPGAIDMIKESFKQMEDYNIKVEESKAVPGTVLPELPLETLKETLIKSRAEVAKWIRDNISRESTRSFFSWRN
jgi:hypothetical protein